MENGEWEMGNRELEMGNGKWRMENGKDLRIYLSDMHEKFVSHLSTATEINSKRTGDFVSPRI